MNAWHELAGPPGGDVLALGEDDDGAILAATASAVHTSRDGGATWTPAGGDRRVAIAGGVVWRVPGPAPDASGPPHPTPGPGGVAREVVALAVDGEHVWQATRERWLGSYPAPGRHGVPLLHHAARTDEYLLISGDGGATWRRLDRAGTTGLALDGAGRVWRASHDGVEVADIAAALADTPAAWRRALERPATCVAVAGDGRVVVGTGGGPAWRSADGAGFAALPARAEQHGPWGALEIEATGFRALRRAPDGSVWGLVAMGLVRLAPGDRAWQAVNLGLTVLPGRGMRPDTVEVRALGFAADGTALAATARHGLFRSLPGRPRG